MQHQVLSGSKVQLGRSIRPLPGKKVDISILGLLDWAFRREGAQLDLSREALFGIEHRPNYGMEYVLIEQARLGCRVDGGGYSASHPDADIVAAAVAVLPEGCGGQRMAIAIAEHARAGTLPDWGQGIGPCECTARNWKLHKGKLWAAKEFYRGRGQWPETWLGRDDGYVCPVTFSGTAKEAAAARRGWLMWWAALLELRSTFQIRSDLSAWAVTDEMPPQAPWGQKAKGA